jgi:hypothetical protein
MLYRGPLEFSGQPHTHKTDDIEPRTAAFSAAVYDALLPTDPVFPTWRDAAENVQPAWGAHYWGKFALAEAILRPKSTEPHHSRVT